ncbi:MAG: ribosomal-processing cysteine protease Prp [Clostridia bacterium]|nr:ribosomal-processing cysteine protease Prp [Clostridia bacterium]
MIRAHFDTDEQGLICAVSLTGHADYTEQGIDPLCAAVTGMVTLVANTLTEVLKVRASVTAEEAGRFFMTVPADGREKAQPTLLGLKVQLQDYTAQYPKHISVSVHD